MDCVIVCGVTSRAEAPRALLEPVVPRAEPERCDTRFRLKCAFMWDMTAAIHACICGEALLLFVFLCFVWI